MLNRVPRICGRLACVPSHSALAAGFLGLFALSLTGDARIASTASFVPADVAVSPELNVPDIADPGAFVLPQSAPLPPRAPRHAFASRLRSGVVRSRSGASARVAPRYAAQFQCLVDW